LALDLCDVLCFSILLIPLLKIQIRKILNKVIVLYPLYSCMKVKNSRIFLKISRDRFKTSLKLLINMRGKY